MLNRRDRWSSVRLRDSSVLPALTWPVRFGRSGPSRGCAFQVPRALQVTQTMRITGGSARGITLLVPKGTAVRPATDGMRQAVFSSLGPMVVGARFLDLFAGSGAYGLEALSRGAASGVWVERHGKTAELLRKNLRAVCHSLKRGEDHLQVVVADALTVPWSIAEPPDLIFIDPPYEQIPELAPALFRQLAERFAGARPLVLFELPGGTDVRPEGWTEIKRLGQGLRQPTVACFRPAGAPPTPT